METYIGDIAVRPEYYGYDIPKTSEERVSALGFSPLFLNVLKYRSLFATSLHAYHRNPMYLLSYKKDYENRKKQ